MCRYTQWNFNCGHKTRPTTGTPWCSPDYEPVQLCPSARQRGAQCDIEQPEVFEYNTPCTACVQDKAEKEAARFRQKTPDLPEDLEYPSTQCSREADQRREARLEGLSVQSPTVAMSQLEQVSVSKGRKKGSRPQPLRLSVAQQIAQQGANAREQKILTQKASESAQFEGKNSQLPK
jgi:hypothetical protein